MIKNKSAVTRILRTGILHEDLSDVLETSAQSSYETTEMLQSLGLVMGTDVERQHVGHQAAACHVSERSGASLIPAAWEQSRDLNITCQISV